MIKYSEQWDAYYDDVTNEWTESKCDDPTCEYCAERPEKPMDGVMVTVADKSLNENLRVLMIEAGYAAPELAGRVRKFAELLIKDVCVDLYAEDTMEIYSRYGLTYEPKMFQIPDFCDLIPIKEWEEACDTGCFISDDGSGYWATDTLESHLSVWSIEKPEWATHVAWYNK